MEKSTINRYVVDEDGTYKVIEKLDLTGGFSLKYTKEQKEKICYVKSDYQPHKLENNYYYNKMAGNVTAGYLVIRDGEMVVVPGDVDAPGDDWYILLRSHLNIELIKAFRKSWMWLLWIFIPVAIIILLIVGVVTYNQMNKNKDKEQVSIGKVICGTDKRTGYVYSRFDRRYWYDAGNIRIEYDLYDSTG